jgi:hypothetical protein
MKTVTYDETKWQLVPKYPDDNMEKAGSKCKGPVLGETYISFVGCDVAIQVYKAMLSAAPTMEGEE